MSHLDLISFRMLIDRVPDKARAHLRQVFLPIAGPLAVAGLLLISIQSDLMGDLFGRPESLGTAGLAFGGIFLMVVAYLAVYGLTFSALLVASMDAVSGHPVNMLRAWRFPLHPAVLATLILVAAVNAAAFMMCFLPALYVAPIMAFVLPVMVAEGRVGFSAISRSVELAHFNPTGRWTDSTFWRVLTLVLIGTAINYALTMTVQVPFVAVQQILFFRDAAAGDLANPVQMMEGALWIQVPATLLTAVVTAATWLYWSFGVSMLYREVRRRKEAEDLRAAIDELTGAVPEVSDATV